MPTGEKLRISSTEAVHGRTTEKTFCSRMRRAMSCEYCAPKSRTTMDCASINKDARTRGQCKGRKRLLATGVLSRKFVQHQIEVSFRATEGSEESMYFDFQIHRSLAPLGMTVLIS